MASRLLFTSAIEGTFILGLGRQLTPRLRERLKTDVGIDLSHLLAGYPAETFLAGVRLVQAELYPALSSEASERELGAMAFTGYAQTLLGRAMVQLTRLIGPERTMFRLAQNMRGSVNFMHIESKKIAPGDFEVEVSDVGGLPYFYEGLFHAGMRDTRAANVRVSVLEHDGVRCRYAVKWSPSPT